MSTRQSIKLHSDVFSYDDVDVKKLNHPTVTVCTLCKKYINALKSTEDKHSEIYLTADFLKCFLFCELIHNLKIESPKYATAESDAKAVLEKYSAVSEKIQNSIAHGAIPSRGRQSYSDKIIDRWKYIRVAFPTDKLEIRFWSTVALASVEMIFHLSSTLAFWAVFYFWFAAENWDKACVSLLYSLFSAIILHAFETDPLNSTKHLLFISFAKCCAAIYFFARIYEKYGLTYNCLLYTSDAADE